MSVNADPANVRGVRRKNDTRDEGGCQSRRRTRHERLVPRRTGIYGVLVY